MDNFVAFNEIYGQYFKGETAPARSTVAVKTLPKMFWLKLIQSHLKLEIFSSFYYSINIIPQIKYHIR